MTVGDVMTRDVVSVAPEAPLKDAAAVLAEHRVSGVPVVNEDGRVLGVLSGADLLWKEIGLCTCDASLIGRVLDRAYGDDARAEAKTAGEAMSSPAITVTSDETVACAARLMVVHRVNRLPVVEHGRLVGIVSRSDLVRAFNQSDEEIEREISLELLETAWIDPDAVSLVVTGGRVEVAGELENRSTVRLVEGLISRVPGVVSVDSTLTWQMDDRARRTARNI